MSNLFNLIIPLNRPSKDYSRCALLIYISAIIVVLLKFGGLLSVSLVCALLIQLIWIIYKKTPMPAYVCLYCKDKAWSLVDANGVTHNFTHARLNFDARFILGITLHSPQKSKRILIFADQLPLATISHLRVLLKVS